LLTRGLLPDYCKKAKALRKTSWLFAD